MVILNSFEKLFDVLKFIILKISSVTSLGLKRFSVKDWRRFYSIIHNSLTFDKFSTWEDKADAISRLIYIQRTNNSSNTNIIRIIIIILTFF